MDEAPKRAMVEVASEVAVKLTKENWTAEPQPDDWAGKGMAAYLNGPDGMRIFLRHGSYGADKGRINVSVHFPQDYYPRGYNGDNNQSISVAESRGSEILAKEIERRLLPWYRTRYAKAIADKATHDDGERKRAEALKQLCAILGEKYDPEGRNNGYQRETVHFYKSNGPSGDFRVNWDANGVDIKLSTSLEMAKRVAEMIAKAKNHDSNTETT